jgi:amidohydrolase
MLGKAMDLADELVRLRRDIHQHPELGFQEFRTAALVAESLEELGIEAKTGVGRTGVVADLGSGNGPTLAIRADMDALPIDEQNDVPYRSVNPGVMHACGHDAHTAMLLGVAHLLRQSQASDEWNGNVRLIFQPSEESGDDDGISGATAMLNDGALEGVDAAIALHVISDLPAGICYFQDGNSLASVDSFKGWIRGDGGHGAYPHKGKDPLFMLGPILTYLYAIPSREINPLRSTVVSLGQIHGGATSNVIPREVFIEGTIRSYEQEIREQLWQEVEQGFKLSESLGGSYEFQLTKGYPAMINDSEVNGWIRSSARDLLNDDQVAEREFGMGAEDFAYMTRLVKGAMFNLGAAAPNEAKRHHHTDTFDIDETILPIGAAVLAETARRFVTGS